MINVLKQETARLIKLIRMHCELGNLRNALKVIEEEKDILKALNEPKQDIEEATRIMDELEKRILSKITDNEIQAIRNKEAQEISKLRNGE